jgi:hypothetical protein
MQSRDRGLPSSTPWGLVLAIGVLAVVFGLIVVANPFDSLRVVTALIGVFMLVAGIAGLVAGRGRGATGVAGPLVAIIGGVILLVLPGVTLKVLAVVVGIILLVWGIVSALAAARDRGPGGGGSVAGGVVLAVLGLVVVVWPGPTLALITLLVGIAVLLFGVAMIVQAIRMRS